MSAEIHEGTLYVTKLCGPASLGDDRALWQFTLPLGSDYVTLGRAEVVALAAALTESARAVSGQETP